MILINTFMYNSSNDSDNLFRNTSPSKLSCKGARMSPPKSSATNLIPYPIIASATTAPPNTHLLLPVTAGTPAVLVAEDAVWAPPLELPPDPEVFVGAPEVVVGATLPLFVVEGTAELGESLEPPAARAVTITGMYGWSVPVYVSVDMPGKLASVPPNDSMQTAEVVPAREQSTMPVKARLPSASNSAGIVYLAVAGPSVSVTTPLKPQSLLSVPGAHCMA